MMNEFGNDGGLFMGCFQLEAVRSRFVFVRFELRRI
jgi:hypothetical protein